MVGMMFLLHSVCWREVLNNNNVITSSADHQHQRWQ